MSNADSEIPKFALFGENTPTFGDSIQPTLDLRSWTDVSKEERGIALQEILNNGWLTGRTEKELIGAIDHLNNTYLRLCPAKNFHSAPQNDDGRGNFDRATLQAAVKDFSRIFLEEAEPLVLRKRWLRLVGQHAVVLKWSLAVADYAAVSRVVRLS